MDEPVLYHNTQLSKETILNCFLGTLFISGSEKFNEISARNS